jgi:hypothetical protein
MTLAIGVMSNMYSRLRRVKICTIGSRNDLQQSAETVLGTKNLLSATLHAKSFRLRLLSVDVHLCPAILFAMPICFCKVLLS